MSPGRNGCPFAQYSGGRVTQKPSRVESCHSCVFDHRPGRGEAPRLAGLGEDGGGAYGRQTASQRLADVEDRMVAALDEPGLTALVTSIAGLNGNSVLVVTPPPPSPWCSRFAARGP